MSLHMKLTIFIFKCRDQSEADPCVIDINITNLTQNCDDHTLHNTHKCSLRVILSETHTCQVFLLLVAFGKCLENKFSSVIIYFYRHYIWHNLKYFRMESMLKLLVDWIGYYTTLYTLELNCVNESSHDDEMAIRKMVSFMYLCKIIITSNVHIK